MRARLFVAVFLIASAAQAWNFTGHQIVAGIAWDNMSETARAKAIAVLQAAPDDACLRDLMPADDRPLAERQREFFMRAATWPDLVRPAKDDTRACTRYHHPNWHFINYFWQGVSGTTGATAPKERTDIEVPEVNAVERLALFRPYVTCDQAACGTTPAERATTLPWILHLVGDLHQPLHTSARTTTNADELKGDQGGNLFKTGTGERPPSLHGFWDGILDRTITRHADEPTIVYLDRVIGVITHDRPRASLAGNLHSGDAQEWSREGLTTTMSIIYPQSLERGVQPSETYRKMAFETSETAVALAGYRLADMLNRMFP